MMSSILLAAQATLPKTGTEWNLTEAGIITGACLLCLLIIPRTFAILTLDVRAFALSVAVQ